MLTTNFNPVCFLNYSKPLAIAQDFANRFKQIKMRDALYAGAIVAIGLAALAFSQALLGTTFILYGSYKFYQILYPSQNRVREFLEEAQSRLSGLQEAIKGNSQSIDSIEKNRDILETNLNDLKKRLTEIQGLANTGNEELEKLKKEAAQLYQEAIEVFDQAEKLSQVSQTSIEQADQTFNQAFSQLQQFKNSAQMQESQVEQERVRFNNLYEKCTAAHIARQQHCQSLVRANQLYRQAFLLHSQASETDKKAVIKAQEFFKEIERQTQIKHIEEESHRVLEEMKKELGILKEKANEEGKMIEGLRGNLNQAGEAAEMQFGLKSVILGGGGGAVIGALGGIVGAGAGAAAGAVAFHNRDKVGDLVIGKDPEATPSKPTKEQPVTYQFNPKATGLLGRLVGRSSQTCGKVAVALHEGESIELKFDLNSPHKVVHKDLTHLCKRITENLESNPTLASYYLGVLDTLTTMVIDRSHESTPSILSAIDSSHKPAVGFINPEEQLVKKLKACVTTLQKGQVDLQKLQTTAPVA